MVKSFAANIGEMVNVNGTLFFSTPYGVQGGELWKSDGTETGTVLVPNIRASYLINVNGTLFFSALDVVYGRELWKLQVGDPPPNLVHTITGGVTDIQGAPVPGVTILTDGGQSATTDASGNYIITNLISDTYTLSPTLTGYTFSPTLRTVSVPPDASGQDFIRNKPPLVLVHGWQDDDDGWNGKKPELSCDMFNDQQNPVEIVRYSEYKDNPTYAVEYWADLPAWLEEDYDVWVAQWKTGTGGTPSLEYQGACLKNQIDYVYEQTGQTDNHVITLVGHSTGGPVSRVCLRYKDCYDKVKALVTLGAPHAGLPISMMSVNYADIRNKPWYEIDINTLIFFWLPDCEEQPAVCEMSFQNMIDFNRRNPNQPGIKYFFLGSEDTPFDLGQIPFNLGEGMFGRDWKNDGLVGAYSAVGWSYLNFLMTRFNPTWWPYKSLPTQIWTADEVHSRCYAFDTDIGSCNTNIPQLRNDYYSYRVKDPDKGRRSHAYQCLIAWLQDEPLPNFCQTATPDSANLNVSSDQPNLLQSTESQVGYLTTGQSATHNLLIDTNKASTFFIFWNFGQIRFNLIRPDGQIIDSDYAAAHPDEVTYISNIDGPNGLNYAAYTFNTTLPGTWQTDIVAEDAGTTGLNYRTFAALESDRSFTVDIDSTTYQSGQTAILTAELKNTNGGLTGATVTATLALPNDQIETLTLSHHGNGIYRATYTIPSAPGFSPVVVTATGTDNGTTFSRQDFLLFTVAPNDAQLSGSYSEQPRDDNGDGLYETLDIMVELNISKAGTYALSAYLEANGQPIAYAGSYEVLTGGLQTIRLRFSGNDIRAAQLNGPFTVSNLDIVSVESGFVLESADNVWTTASYKWDEFGVNTNKDQYIYLPIIIKN